MSKAPDMKFRSCGEMLMLRVCELHVLRNYQVDLQPKHLEDANSCNARPLLLLQEFST